MSREIKFRVWAKKRKGYRELDQLVFNNQGLEEIWVFPKDDEMQQVYHPSEMVVEQYTGFTDKNGKEIYEGDIVRVSYGYNYEVRQLKSGAWRIGRDDLCVWADSSEVIGNIHENKELLEETK